VFEVARRLFLVRPQVGQSDGLAVVFVGERDELGSGTGAVTLMGHCNEEDKNAAWVVCDLGGADSSATSQCAGGKSLDQASAAINQFLPARFHTVRYLPWSCLVVPSVWGTLIRYVPTSQATSPLCLM
jgi:hypothetical protein